MRDRRPSRHGFPLPEVTIVLAVVSILVMISAPAVSELATQLSVRSATMELSAVFLRARARAVFERRNVGIRWISVAGDVSYTIYDDLNGNGVLTEDIRKGIDRPVVGPISMQKRYPGITFTFLPKFDARDPGGEKIGDLADPVRFGRSDICTFSPLGDSSPGSIYLSNGRNRQAVVRISPQTGKIQVYEWAKARKTWVPL